MTTQYLQAPSFYQMQSAAPPSPNYYSGDVLFPWKLHEMLEAAETNSFTTVVSWMPDQRSFKVHDKETFVSLIMQRYFDQTKYKSFQRQLNMWGFERHLCGPSKGGYTHRYFLRGEPGLCCRMARSKKQKREGGRTKKPATPAIVVLEKVTTPEQKEGQAHQTTQSSSEQLRLITPDLQPKTIVAPPLAMLRTSTTSACSVVSTEGSSSYHGTELANKQGIIPFMKRQQKEYRERSATLLVHPYANAGINAQEQATMIFLEKKRNEINHNAQNMAKCSEIAPVAVIVPDATEEDDALEAFNGMRFFPVHDACDESCAFCVSRGRGEFLL